MRFEHKGYGRIFVEKREDIERLKAIMRAIDQEEFDGYYPGGNYYGSGEELITVFEPENYHSIYVGKFDDMDIMQVIGEAWKQGIKCFAAFGKITGFEE